MSGHVPAARPVPPRDFDGIFKALMDAHPRDALQLLCGATLRDGDVITAEPTEQSRQRNRQCDKVITVRHDDGTPTDVYHSWNASPTGSPPPRNTRTNCSRPNWVCWWEAPWRPNW